MTATRVIDACSSAIVRSETKARAARLLLLPDRWLIFAYTYLRSTGELRREHSHHILTEIGIDGDLYYAIENV